MASRAATVRVGQAAEMLGVSVDTIRRWIDDGRLAATRSTGGQRAVPVEEVARLLREHRARAADEQRTRRRPATASSARNRFPGVVTRIDLDRVVAVVEVQAGPHRLVSLMTAEAVKELGLRVGDDAIGVVKATNVVIEVPPPASRR